MDPARRVLRTLYASFPDRVPGTTRVLEVEVASGDEPTLVFMRIGGVWYGKRRNVSDWTKSDPMTRTRGRRIREIYTYVSSGGNDVILRHWPIRPPASSHEH